MTPLRSANTSPAPSLKSTSIGRPVSGTRTRIAARRCVARVVATRGCARRSRDRARPACPRPAARATRQRLVGLRRPSTRGRSRTCPVVEQQPMARATRRRRSPPTRQRERRRPSDRGCAISSVSRCRDRRERAQRRRPSRRSPAPGAHRRCAMPSIASSVASSDSTRSRRRPSARRQHDSAACGSTLLQPRGDAIGAAVRQHRQQVDVRRQLGACRSRRAAARVGHRGAAERDADRVATARALRSPPACTAKRATRGRLVDRRSTSSIGQRGAVPLEQAAAARAPRRRRPRPRPARRTTSQTGTPRAGERASSRASSAGIAPVERDARRGRRRERQRARAHRARRSAEPARLVVNRRAAARRRRPPRAPAARRARGRQARAPAMQHAERSECSRRLRDGVDDASERTERGAGAESRAAAPRNPPSRK